MAKSLIGLEFATNVIRVATVSNGQVKKACTIDMPENMVKMGRIVSIEAMSELLKNSLKKNGIDGKEAAIVLGGDNCFIKNITMPRMDHNQLLVNLPYEFRDYITGEFKDYVFDYAMYSTKEEIEKNDDDQAMELMAVACEKSLIEEYTACLKKAGLKLVRVEPEVSAFANIIRNNELLSKKESCILDVGYHSTRMYIYKGDRHDVTRVIEIGLADIEKVIAEKYNLDIYIAHTFFVANHENCQNIEEIDTIYRRILSELTRALNFYRFSNRESELQDLWVCGDGASVNSFVESLKETIDLDVHIADELVDSKVKPIHSYLKCIGACLN